MHGESDRSSALVVRLNSGDPTAGDALFARMYPRLLQLAMLMLGGYRDLRGRHSAESLVHDAWIDLQTALRAVRPADSQHYLMLGAGKVRFALLDLAKKERRRLETVSLGGRSPEADGSSPGFDPSADSSCDPGRLELWTRFHEAVGELPDELRGPFVLFFYADEKPSQARVAESLGVHPRTASRLIARAKVEIAKRIGGFEQLLV